MIFYDTHITTAMPPVGIHAPTRASGNQKSRESKIGRSNKTKTKRKIRILNQNSWEGGVKVWVRGMGGGDVSM